LPQELRVEIEQLKSFRTLVEASHQLVSIHSLSAEGTFLYANSVFFRALNYVPQDLIGQPLLNLCHPQDRPLLSAALMRATTGKRGSHLPRPAAAAAVNPLTCFALTIFLTLHVSQVKAAPA
jgi:PAS domain-containing protein